MENNKMISFRELIEECFNKYEIYIPLIQRNYKWDKETASKLVKDLWASYKKESPVYTAGMITLYQEEGNKMQLIDGQQRTITLFMLLKILEPKEEYFQFKFERDDDIEEEKNKREYYLSHISEISQSKDVYTDIKRFNDNYKEMKNEMESEDRKEQYSSFREYILNNLYFLIHISEVEPFDEFINLNKNKTRFVISDRIKANLILNYSTEDERDNILSLFKELSRLLFLNSDKTDSVWNLISQGYIEEKIPEDNSKRIKYKLYPDENRLKLLCCERYGSNDNDGSSMMGYEKETEYETLELYRKILSILENDKKEGNWSSYNGFNAIHHLAKDNDAEKRLFSLLNKYKDEKFDYLEEFYKHLLLEKNVKKNAFYISCFVESQLKNEFSDVKKEIIDKYKNIQKELENKENAKSNWISSGMKEVKEYLQIYDMYIQNKYKLKEKYDEQ